MPTPVGKLKKGGTGNDNDTRRKHTADQARADKATHGKGRMARRKKRWAEDNQTHTQDEAEDRS